MAVKIFRWKAIGPLLLFLAIVAVLVWLFAEPVAEDTTEEVGTELLGTQVDIGKLDIRANESSVDLRALEIADPFDLAKNLVEAEEIRVKLNPLALAEKKIVIENFRLAGVRFGTTRRTPAKPVEGDGFASQALRSVRAWAEQFDVPLLQLTPIDTVRQLVLNPTQLTTVQTAQALAGRADSARKGLDQSFQQLDVQGTVDSTRALVTRLKASDPRKLGLDGTRRAIEDARAGLARLGEAKKRVENLERQVEGGVGSLTAGLQNLDEARKKDYAFARSLLKLPTFSAPEIGEAFFGKVSIDRFQQALYYTELARRYPCGKRGVVDEVVVLSVGLARPRRSRGERDGERQVADFRQHVRSDARLSRARRPRDDEQAALPSHRLASDSHHPLLTPRSAPAADGGVCGARRAPDVPAGRRARDGSRRRVQ